MVGLLAIRNPQSAIRNPQSKDPQSKTRLTSTHSAVIIVSL
jgi:hypothetical protein